jgi:uncharacterized protein YbjT (DUF2867 family)
MNVAVFGGTGYVGSYLVAALIAHGHQPVLLVRPGSEKKLRQAERCRLEPGQIQDEEAVRRTLDHCDAVFYNIGILRQFPRQGITFEALQYEGARRVIDAAVDAGVKRFLLVSANGAKPDGTAYQRTKYHAEEYLRSTELEGTVFRPSVMFGDPRGRMEFATQLRDEMIRSPMPAPLFYEGLLPIGAGKFRLAPVHVQDVAEIYVRALESPQAVGKTYPLCGPKSLEWHVIIQTIGRAVGKEKWTLPVPAYLVKTAAAIFEGFEMFPITRDQLTMLVEGNTCDSSAVFDAFGIEPTAFNEESLAYLRE